LIGDRLRPALALAAIVAALGLSACGRKGPLEMPPGPATEPPVAAAPASPSFLPAAASPAAPAPYAGQQPEDAAAVKNGFDAQGNPVAAAGQKKSFVLDPLLH
jgi:predicted small lipoprotein YifL